MFLYIVFPKKPAGTLCVGGGWLAVGDWRLVAVGGGWRRLVLGDWWLMAVAVVGGWRWVVAGGWRLVAVGGWQLMVPWVGP